MSFLQNLLGLFFLPFDSFSFQICPLSECLILIDQVLPIQNPLRFLLFYFLDLLQQLIPPDIQFFRGIDHLEQFLVISITVMILQYQMVVPVLWGWTLVYLWFADGNAADQCSRILRAAFVGSAGKECSWVITGWRGIEGGARCSLSYCLDLEICYF